MKMKMPGVAPGPFFFLRLWCRHNHRFRTAHGRTHSWRVCTNFITMRCDIDCASSFNLAKSTKYDSKTNGKKSIFQCMRAQAGELSQIPKMSLLEKLHEIPGILGGWYLNVPGSTNGFFNPSAYLHGKKNPYPHMGVCHAYTQFVLSRLHSSIPQHRVPAQLTSNQRWVFPSAASKSGEST